MMRRRILTYDSGEETADTYEQLHLSIA